MKIAPGIVALTVLVGACSSKVDNAQHTAGLTAIVESTPSWVDDSPLGQRLWKIEQEFYSRRNYLPA